MDVGDGEAVGVTVCVGMDVLLTLVVITVGNVSRSMTIRGVGVAAAVGGVEANVPLRRKANAVKTTKTTIIPMIQNGV